MGKLDFYAGESFNKKNYAAYEILGADLYPYSLAIQEEMKKQFEEMQEEIEEKYDLTQEQKELLENIRKESIGQEKPRQYKKPVSL